MQVVSATVNSRCKFVLSRANGSLGWPKLCALSACMQQVSNSMGWWGMRPNSNSLYAAILTASTVYMLLYCCVPPPFLLTWHHGTAALCQWQQQGCDACQPSRACPLMIVAAAVAVGTFCLQRLPVNQCTCFAVLCCAVLLRMLT